VCAITPAGLLLSSALCAQYFPISGRHYGQISLQICFLDVHLWDLMRLIATISMHAQFASLPIAWNMTDIAWMCFSLLGIMQCCSLETKEENFIGYLRSDSVITLLSKEMVA
jgi:hypothetical protein